MSQADYETGQQVELFRTFMRNGKYVDDWEKGLVILATEWQIGVLTQDGCQYIFSLPTKFVRRST